MCKYCEDSYIDVFGDVPDDVDSIKAIILQDGSLVIDSFSEDVCGGGVEWNDFDSKSEFEKHNRGVDGLVNRGAYVVQLSYCPFCGRKF